MFNARALVMPALLAAPVWTAFAGEGSPQAPVAQGSPAPGCACIVVPPLTPVTVEILVPLGSKISRSGEAFPIRLAAPIVVDGREVVPAGTPGMGEVVHAKKSGGSGAPGELVLAARHLEFAGQRIRLRSLNFAQAGKDNYGVVNSIAIGAAATVAPVALVGFAINGKEQDVPAGTVAQARLAEVVTLDSASAPAGDDPALAGPSAVRAPTTREASQEQGGYHVAQ